MCREGSLRITTQTLRYRGPTEVKAARALAAGLALRPAEVPSPVYSIHIHRYKGNGRGWRSNAAWYKYPKS